MPGKLATLPICFNCTQIGEGLEQRSEIEGRGRAYGRDEAAALASSCAIGFELLEHELLQCIVHVERARYLSVASEVGEQWYQRTSAQAPLYFTFMPGTKPFLMVHLQRPSG
jgi:hypothetical protein